MNEKDLIRKAMSALGKRKSTAKTEAARRNARKGGWPKGRKRTLAYRVQKEDE